MKKTIMLDPGHGDRDPGTIGNHPSITVVEKDLNLSIARYARRYIQRYYSNEILTYITRL